MKQATWIRTLTMAALLLVAPALTRAQDGDLAVRLADAGWEQVDSHVFQRHLEDGTVETVSWGPEGVAWELDRVRERIAELKALHLELEEPSLELMDALSQYRSRALELQAELDGEWETPIPRRLHGREPRSLVGAASCILDITLDVFAYPTLTGPAASATAAFSESCGSYGDVTATANAEGLYGGQYRSVFDGDRAAGYGSASANASASVVATSQCLAEAIASVWIEDRYPVPIFKRASNTQCRIVLPGPGDCLTSLAPCTIP